MTIYAESAERLWPQDFTDLYDREFVKLVRLAGSMLGSTSDAEEVVQEAALAVQRRWDRIDEPAAYLRRAVVNGSLGVLRKRKSRERFNADPAPPAAPQELIELRDVFLRLPERQRAAIVLRYVAGLDDVNIAQDLGVRRSTVHSLIARGLASLRNQLEGGSHG